MKSFVRALHPGRFRQHVSAWMNARSGEVYDRYTAARKRALLGKLHGNVLEIGPGAGANLRYYPLDVHWVGVEPNPYMRQRLLQSIRTLGRPPEQFRIDPGDPSGSRLPAQDESVDCVVGTLVLCSVPNPEDSLREILRVLKPGGRFVFMEHVAAPRGTRPRAWQDFLQPFWTLVADGCHPNRETGETISQAGFARVEIEHFQYPRGGLEAPQIAGVATKGLG